MATATSTVDIDALWLKYGETRDQNTRNDIVMHYSGLVKFIAQRMRGTYKNYAQVDDVINQGIISLIDAVEKFEPAKGFKFVDYIRSQDWVPRRLRKMSADLDDAYNRLYSELGRQPTNMELAKSMNITTEQLDRVMESTYNFTLLSYEEVVWQKMSAMGEEPSTDNIEESPERKLMEKELREQLGMAVDSLNERERTVVSLYYYENLKLKEIADVLGVSESRVCQIHSSAILKMKKIMKEYIE